MNITRKSLVSGKLHTLDLPVTEEQLRAYADGALLQDAFPDLAAPLREFIKTGVTPEEWEAQVLGKIASGLPRIEDAIKVIGKFQRNSDGNFVGFIDVPEGAGDDGHLRCLMVQADPEDDDDCNFLEVIWHPALDQ
jgi:hypothetical protein